jgi:hypothetical protein
LTVPLILNSNVVEIGNSTAGSITEILSPIQTYFSTVGTLTSGSPGITAAQFLGRIIEYTGSTSITSPIDTAANFITALSAAGASPFIGETMNCKLVNAGTGAITLAASSDSSITLVGPTSVASGAAAELVLRLSNVTTGTAAGVMFT